MFVGQKRRGRPDGIDVYERQRSRPEKYVV